MPAHKRLNVVEFIVVVAFIAILASILFPMFERAKQRAAQEAGETAAPQPAPTPDGLLNTIEVSDVSEDARSERSKPENYLAPLGAVVPLAVVGAAALVLFLRFRRRRRRRAH